MGRCGSRGAARRGSNRMRRGTVGCTTLEQPEGLRKKSPHARPRLRPPPPRVAAVRVQQRGVRLRACVRPIRPRCAAHGVAARNCWNEPSATDYGGGARCAPAAQWRRGALCADGAPGGRTAHAAPLGGRSVGKRCAGCGDGDRHSAGDRKRAFRRRRARRCRRRCARRPRARLGGAGDAARAAGQRAAPLGGLPHASGACERPSCYNACVLV
jgi:hypothetical protein